MKVKTLNRSTRVTSLLMALILVVSLFTVTAPPASAAGGTIHFGLWTQAVTGNLDAAAFPGHHSTVEIGNYYINVAGDSSVKLKTIEAYVSTNGSNYTMAGKEVASGYLRWAYFPIKLSTAGKLNILVRVTYTDGRSAQGSTTVTVKGGNTNSTSSFNPVWPAQSANYISTYLYYYNSGRPYKHSTRSNYQNAVDIAGSGNVVAIESGTVVKAGWDGGFGYAVTIRHSNGLYSLYGHLSSISVNVGQSVSRGQKIGVMGSTGNSTGRHLHLEVYNPSNTAQVINPWVNYYQGKVSVVVGGNSRKASASFPNDAASRAWVSYLNTYGVKRSDGDFALN